MFSYNITLNEFVCSIPICQPEADLGSVLQIFYQTNCDSLAISNRDLTWGIINSRDILSLLAKSWQRLPIATVGYPKQIPPQRKVCSDSRDFYSIIQPTIVCQADTPVREFLESLENNYFEIGQSNYLIVNRAGELQGRLDRDKLLRYVAAKLRQHKTDFELPRSSTFLLTMLDRLPLPLKIETADQKNCYENRCWQKLISHNRDKHSIQSQESNVSIANWWIKKQLEMLQHNNEGDQKLPPINNADEFCCLGNGYYPLHESNVRSQAISLSSSNSENLEVKQSLGEYRDDFAMSCLFDDSYTDETGNYPLGIQVEEDVEWNYIKIPLRLDDRELAKTQSGAYWLILAIESSLSASNNSQKEENSSPTKSTVDRLLATISHELKSPLTGIVGLSSLLNSQQIGTLNQRQIQYVRLVRDSAQKLMSIVNDLIELTSLTTGKLEPQLEAINLEFLFRQLYRQIITKFETTDSTGTDLLMLTSGLEVNLQSGLEVNLQSGLEIAIADKLRLSSIISHLMLETIQFCGSTSIALTINVKEIDGYYSITLKNQGNNTLEGSTKDSDLFGHDIGLDVVIAQHLAQTIQGNIKSIYRSQSCSFTLSLPIIEPQSDNNARSTVPDRSNTAGKTSEKNLTILCLYPESKVIDINLNCDRNLDFNLKKWLEQNLSDNSESGINYRHRIIEADGLEQAHTLARIWQLDAIVLDGYQIVDSERYLRSLQKSEHLSALPLITLDTKTTEAANQIEGLNIYPCLLPAQCRSIKDLMQVIQIATEK